MSVSPRRAYASGARQYPFNGKKARTERGDSGRPWFAEIVDDAGKRTKVPCKYDSEKRMYVPTGGRDVVPGGKVTARGHVCVCYPPICLSVSVYVYVHV